MADVNMLHNIEHGIQEIKSKSCHLKSFDEHEDIHNCIENLYQLVSRDKIGVEMDAEFLGVLERLVHFCVEHTSLTTSDVVIVSATNCYRLCRNLCALCTNNQNTIHSIGTFIDATDKLLRAVVTMERRSEPMLVLLRCMTQFLGNYISGNQTNQMEVWSKFQGHFKQLVESNDQKLADYTLMVIHLCLTNTGAVHPPTSPQSWELFTSAVHFTTDADSHNGLLVFEDALKLSGFCEHVYSKVPLPSKILILEVLISQLKSLPEEMVGRGTDYGGAGNTDCPNPADRGTDCDGPGSADCPSPADRGTDCDGPGRNDCPSPENIQYIAADYIMQAHCILNMYTDASTESQALCTVKALECVCLATSHHKLYSTLQDNQQLIKVTVSLLQGIEDIGRQGNSVFTNVDKMSERHNIKIDHPVFGLKRDLIRLLGNMAYKHRGNQDLIRELDGISLILDQTNIDGKNPFITQWAVFAVYNLTEQNEDNRLFIANLRLEGVANNSSVLEEMGLEADTDGDKVVIKQKKRQ